MRAIGALAILIAAWTADASAQTIKLEHGQWFNGRGFEPRTMYVVNGVLRTAAPATIDSTISLRGGYVVGPYGEAHNHNIAQSSRIDALLKRYADEGIFYVLNPNSLPGDRLAGRINTPGTLQAIFANGGLNVTRGHPWDLVERNIARGTWKRENAEGAFYHTIDSLPDLERKWPAILAGRPDIIKVYLLFTNEHDQRKDTDHKGFIGLGPAVIKPIVDRAHAAGLRVAAHIENAFDFTTAVEAGVDIVAHAPGYGWLGVGDSSQFVISPEAARAAAARGTAVITTMAFGRRANDENRLAGQIRRDNLNARNLRTLKAAGVTIAIGSDNFGATSRSEALYLSDLGVFTNAELLRIWSETTPKVILPTRRIGSLNDGDEASFLVLDADPLMKFEDTGRIRLRIMQGRIVPPAQ